ncbi:MAG: anti-sigma factor antagonist [Clostridia bacterium]|nr:anti-sigma factor antagonist [Clostridia bacterium]
MDIEYNGQRRALIVRLDAEVDHHSAAQIRESVDAQFLRTKANHIIFDFSSLQFMDSSGIGLIMGRYRLIRPLDGKIVLAGVSEQLDRLMSLSGIYK